MFRFIEFPDAFSRIFLKQSESIRVPRQLGNRNNPKRSTKSVDATTETSDSILAYRNYLLSASPAIEGQNGDDWTFEVCAVARDFGLSPNTTFNLLLEYFNPYCQPSWEEEELWKKVKSAFQSATGEHGAAKDALKVHASDAAPTEYPKYALSGYLENAANDIRTITQAPFAIGAQSLLAALATVAQNHVNVELPHGSIKPVSLFFLTIAASG